MQPCHGAVKMWAGWAGELGASGTGAADLMVATRIRSESVVRNAKATLESWNWVSVVFRRLKKRLLQSGTGTLVVVGGDLLHQFDDPAPQFWGLDAHEGPVQREPVRSGEEVRDIGGGGRLAKSRL